MRTGEKFLALPSLLVLLTLPACDKPTTPSKHDSDAASATGGVELEVASIEEAEAAGAPFADAELFFELNATDDDLGLQLFVDSDDGMEAGPGAGPQP